MFCFSFIVTWFAEKETKDEGVLRKRLNKKEGKIEGKSSPDMNQLEYENQIIKIRKQIRALTKHWKSKESRICEKAWVPRGWYCPYMNSHHWWPRIFGPPCDDDSIVGGTQPSGRRGWSNMLGLSLIHCGKGEKKSNDRKKTVVSSKSSQNMGKLRWVEDQNQSYLCDARKQDNQNTPTKRLVWNVVGVMRSWWLEGKTDFFRCPF